MISFVRSSITVSLLTLGSRFAGFFREAMMATYLGCGGLADALVISIKFPSIFRRILAEGSLNPSFIPTFVKIVVIEGRLEARRYAEEIFSILITVLLILTLTVEIFTAYPIQIFFPGFVSTQENLNLAICLSRVTFPFVILISLTAFYSCILNSIGKFFASAASPMVGNFGIIIIVLVLIEILGVQAGMAFSIGVVFCGLIQLVWVLVPTIQEGFSLRFHRPRITKRVENFFFALGPSILSSCAIQVSILVDNTLASFLSEGNISVLHYADRLNQLPLSIFGTAIGTTLLPLLSRQIQAGFLRSAIESQSVALEYSILLTLPSALILTLLPFPIVSVLYVHGRFTLEDACMTSNTLAVLSSGLPAYILVKIFTIALFARGDTRTPLYIGLITVCLNIVLSLLLMRSLSCVGLALSTALSSWIQAFIMGTVLIKKKQLEITNRLRGFLFRILVSCFFSGIIFFILKNLSYPWLIRSKFIQIIALVTLLTLSILSFFLIARFLGALKVREVRDTFKSKYS